MAEQVLREDALALIVTSRKSPYIEALLGAIEKQDLAPARIVVACIDGQFPSSVTQSHPLASFVQAQGRTFSEVVTRVCDGDEQWIWLLHDDVIPAPGCLDALVRQGESSKKIGAVGPKQVRLSDPRHLIEVGIRATRRARRVTEVMPGELDQGQYDWREDVLGVGSAGMLLRRSALEAIGGLDPILGPFGDGLETSRRLWLAGWRVVVAPLAVIEHAQRSLMSGNPVFLGRHRGAQMYNAVLAASPLVAILLFVGYVLAAPVRALYRLIVKDGGGARGQFAGAWFLIRSVPGLVRARRRLRRSRTVSSSVVRSLEDTPAAVRAARREAKKVVRESDELAHMPGPLELKARLEHRSRTIRWGTAAVVISAAVAFAGLITVIGRGPLTGGALLPDAWSARDLLSAAQYWWIPTGDGAAGMIDPLWILLSPLVFLTGTLGTLATGIVLLAIPLAALFAFWASGYWATSPQLRFLLALGWAFAPPLLAAVSVGQVAAIICHLILPVAAAAITAHWRSGSIVSLAVASLALMYLSAAAPVFLVIALVIALGGMIGHRRRIPWLWLPVPALAACAPLAWKALQGEDGWRWFFTVPGVAVSQRPTVLGLASLNPLGTGDDLRFVIPTALLVLGALAGLIRRKSWLRTRVAWLIAALGFVWAGVASSVYTTVTVSGIGWAPTTAWTGIGLSIASFGLWLSLIGTLDGVSRALAGYSIGLRQVGVLGIVVAMCAAVFATSGYWLVRSISGGLTIQVQEAASVPAVAVAQELSSDRSRVLVLSETKDGIVAGLWRNAGTALHETSTLLGLVTLSSMDSDVLTYDSAGESLADSIATIATTGEVGETWAEHAISIVVVPTSEDSERSTLISHLNSSPDLEYITENETGAFWRVTNVSARVRFIDDSGETTALPSGIVGARATVDTSSSGVISLAEVADSGWKATLDGVELTALSGTWNQQWTLPAGSEGASLVISYGNTWERVTVYAQLAVVLITIVMAIPFQRRRRHAR